MIAEIRYETDTWFIIEDKKYYKRIGYCTPWKKIIFDYSKYPKSVDTEALQREFLKYEYIEISREDYLNHKCIDCWHPNGITAHGHSPGGVGDGGEGIYEG